MSSIKTALRSDGVIQRKDPANQQAPVSNVENEARALLSEDAFVSMLYLERRRAERAQKRFVLVLVDVKRALDDGNKSRTLAKIAMALTNSTRETDILGWYLENNLIGIIGTELGETAPKIIHERLLEKFRASFQHTVGKEKSSKISVSFHFFPEEYGKSDSNAAANVALYPDISRKEDSRKLAFGIKRAMDRFRQHVGVTAFLSGAGGHCGRRSSLRPKAPCCSGRNDSASMARRLPSSSFALCTRIAMPRFTRNM